jgi:hypothetical protein
MAFEPVGLRETQQQDRDGPERRGNSEAFEGEGYKPGGEEEGGNEHLSVLLPVMPCEPWADPRHSLLTWRAKRRRVPSRYPGH